MKITLLFALVVSFLTTTFAQTQKVETQIVWDTWGVPHITSNTVEDLFFAQGWAQMHNHANLILEMYGSARGNGAEYWGPSKFDNDMLIHTLGFDALAEEWEKNQDPFLKVSIALL